VSVAQFFSVESDADIFEPIILSGKVNCNLVAFVGVHFFLVD
jgi:hypothetical protein